MAAVAVTPAPLDLHALIGEISGSSSADGAITSFIGVVRDHNQGRKVSFLEYEAYEALAVRALQRILDEARAAWPDTRLGVHHRTGRLELGEASIIIVAVSPHRAHAFAACRYVIEQIKQRLPVWKQERYVGGAASWLAGEVPHAG